MEQVTDKLYNWASEIDEGTMQQALKASRLPIIDGHLALMPDAHLGIGATVGSVIPTAGAIIPAAVGVDVGCGMLAVETTVRARQLPDDLDRFLPVISEAIPAGLGKWHAEASRAAESWFVSNKPPHPLGSDLERRALEQFGTLGSGNHFFEVCEDGEGWAWLVLHSGSRGVGNKLATMHIDKAKELARGLELTLEDPDLAYFLEGTLEFQAYVTDLLWAQSYAAANRDEMMNRATRAFFEFTGRGAETIRVNCHHNFTRKEEHGGREVWITRKGAIKADVNDYGVIPGSMGTKSYIVRGLGNPLSYNSCSHGAGRRMSRGEAKRTFSAEDLATAMKGKVWQEADAEALVDEIPASYKDIDVVMADQADLVEIVRTLRQVLNYKGTDSKKSRRR